MKSLPKIALTPRARRDIQNLLRYIGRQPWGRPSSRRAELDSAFEKIQRAPTARPVRRWVTSARLGLRCRYDGSFAIIYALLTHIGMDGDNIVSVRAVRHCRARDVFLGVKETGTDGDDSSPHALSGPAVLACVDAGELYQTWSTCSDHLSVAKRSVLFAYFRAC